MWLLNEDLAIKNKLIGLTVPEANGTLPVGVRFRFPEDEFARVKYPLIVIEHSGIGVAHDREHRGDKVRLGYAPEGYAPWADMTDPSASPYILNEWPIPYNVDYQITLYCRRAQHARLLTGALLQVDRLPGRYGYVEIPQDGTVRTLELLAGPTADDEIDPDGKRLFKQVWMVRVYTELLNSSITQFTKVTSVNVNTDLIPDVYAQTY